MKGKESTGKSHGFEGLIIFFFLFALIRYNFQRWCRIIEKV